jgi:transposase
MIERGKLRGAAEIGVRIGRVVNKYKVAKHFDLTIEDRRFDFRVLDREVAAEAALDGIYVIRTSVPKAKMSTADTVRSYKALAGVERAFRSMKTIDLKVRPIHHRKADRVRAHIFLCMLAYYVEWHMREGVARAALRGRGPGVQGEARPRGAGEAIGGRRGEGRDARAR